MCRQFKTTIPKEINNFYINKSRTIVTMTSNNNSNNSNSNNKSYSHSTQTEEGIFSFVCVPENLREIDNVGNKDLFFNNCCDGSDEGNLVVTNKGIEKNLIKRWKSDVCYTTITPFHSPCHIITYLSPRHPPLNIYTPEIKEAFIATASFSMTTDEDFIRNVPPHVYTPLSYLLCRTNNNTCSNYLFLFTGPTTNCGKSINLFHSLDFIRFHGNFDKKRNLFSKKLFNFNLILTFFSDALETGETGCFYSSTRCVKLVTVDFDFLGAVVGGGVGTYHLEKWRLTDGYLGNFHIFYTLVGGVSPGEMKTLKLPSRNPEAYKLLKKPYKVINASLPFSNGVIKDYEQGWVFLKTHISLLTTPETFTELTKILAAILHLGNVSFSLVTHLDGTENMEVANGSCDDELIESLLQLPPKTMLLATMTTITTNPQLILDNLITTIYTRLFSWLSGKLSLKSDRKKCFSISFLDYPGVYCNGDGEEETFTSMVTKYINEKIEKELVSRRLRAWQEDFLGDTTYDSGGSGGCGWILLDTGGNYYSVVEGVEGVVQGEGGGEEDDEGEEEFERPFSRSGRRSKSPCSSSLLGPPNKSPHKRRTSRSPTQPHLHSNIQILSVTPQNTSPLSNLPPELTSLLSKSSNALLKSLFPPQQQKLSAIKSTLHTLATSLTSLTNKLNQKVQKTIQIRCISTANSMETSTSHIAHQINTTSKLLDHYKVFKNCYIQKYTFPQFIQRFKLLSLKTWPSYHGNDDRKTVQIIMKDLCFKEGKDFSLGRVKYVFLLDINVVLTLEQYRKERLEDLALLIQKCLRGFIWRRRYKRILKSQKIISRGVRSYFRDRDGRAVSEYRVVRRAVGVVQGGYIHWRRRLHLLYLAENVSNWTSPLCSDWPVGVPSYLQEANELLRIAFHKWRCSHYRKTITPETRLKLNEKATASFLFRGRKIGGCYERSIPHPFLSDYIRLHANSQFRKNVLLKLAQVDKEFNPTIVFADLVTKVARGSGKFLPIILVVTTTTLLFLDPRTLTPKYKISPKRDLRKISMSTFSDEFCVMHISENNVVKETNNSNCLCTVDKNVSIDYGNDTRGDLIIHTNCHLVEMVTKVWLVARGYWTGGIVEDATVKSSSNCCHGNSHYKNYYYNYNQQCVHEEEEEQSSLLGVAFENEIASEFHSSPQTILFTKTIKSGGNNNSADSCGNPGNVKVVKAGGVLEFLL